MQAQHSFMAPALALDSKAGSLTGGPGRILIVDDEATNRVIVERRLKAAGYDTHCVSDGFQALEAMQEWRPDLVLLDVMMPGLSGFDVLERRAAHNALADIPVVMVSAADDESSRIK